MAELLSRWIFLLLWSLCSLMLQQTLSSTFQPTESASTHKHFNVCAFRVKAGSWFTQQFQVWFWILKLEIFGFLLILLKWPLYYVFHSDWRQARSHLLCPIPWDFLKAGVHETPITTCVAQGQFRGSVVLAQKIKNLLYHLLTVLPPTPESSFVHTKLFFISNSALLFWS